MNAQFELDYVETTKNFILKMPRSDQSRINETMQIHGLDFSIPATTRETAVLFTPQPYAAVPFIEHATLSAAMELGVIAERVERSWKQDRIGRHLAMPEGMELWPFQEAGVDYALSVPHALIGDQPGLGKTVQALVVANEIQAQRVLVICPANIRGQWCDMIRKWSTMQGRFSIYPIYSAKAGVHPRAQWTVISYDLARNPNIYAALLNGRYDLLILDEAHFLKTSGAGRTRAIFGGGQHNLAGLSSVCGKVIALTGTPLPNRPSECYTLARGLAWDSIDRMSEDAFKGRFNQQDLITMRNGVFMREKVGRLPELQSRLRGSFMVRRLKKDVLSQLPPVLHSIQHIQPDKSISQALKAESLLHIDPEELSGADAEILGHVSVVRREMGLAMAPHVAEYAAQLIEGGVDKLFLVGWHIAVLDILEERLKRYGIVRIDGSVPEHKRRQRVREFQEDESIRICLGNIQAIGTGTDGLQNVCDYVVGAEASWTSGDNIQVVDRLHRMGQNSSVRAEWMAVEGSFAERILASMIRKLKVVDAALDKEHV